MRFFLNKRCNNLVDYYLPLKKLYTFFIKDQNFQKSEVTWFLTQIIILKINEKILQKKFQKKFNNFIILNLVQDIKPLTILSPNFLRKYLSKR